MASSVASAVSNARKCAHEIFPAEASANDGKSRAFRTENFEKERLLVVTDLSKPQKDGYRPQEVRYIDSRNMFAEFALRFSDCEFPNAIIHRYRVAKSSADPKPFDFYSTKMNISPAQEETLLEVCEALNNYSTNCKEPCVGFEYESIDIHPRKPKKSRSYKDAPDERDNRILALEQKLKDLDLGKKRDKRIIYKEYRDFEAEEKKNGTFDAEKYYDASIQLNLNVDQKTKEFTTKFYLMENGKEIPLNKAQVLDRAIDVNHNLPESQREKNNGYNLSWNGDAVIHIKFYMNTDDLKTSRARLDLAKVFQKTFKKQRDNSRFEDDDAPVPRNRSVAHNELGVSNSLNNEPPADFAQFDPIARSSN